MQHRDERMRRQRSIRRWLARRNIVFAWVVLFIAVVHPPHGTGVSICWIHSSTHVPCPGCGLTRSVSCAARGMWRESWEYHAFGIALLAVFTTIALLGLLGGRPRRRMLRLALRRRTTIGVLYMALIASFIVYGAVRAAESMLR